MFVPFDQLAPESKIWIYQSDTEIPKPDQLLIEEFLASYCDEWTAHGQALKASFQILHNHFVVLGVDESFNSTSGCSVDDSVRAIKQISTQTGLEFFNRERIPFLKNGKVALIPLKQLKANYQSGDWTESSVVFNNLVDSKKKLENEWMVPAGQTWLRRYIPAKILGT